MACYGYARVSSIDQDYLIQEHALHAAGCKIVRAEKVSGTSRQGRSELELLLEFMHEGDTLMVTRVDRLARSIKDLQDIVYTLKEKKVTLKAIEQPIDTHSASGKAFLDMLGVFAEFETNLRRERQLEGIASAKLRGAYRGRKSTIDINEVKRLHYEEKLGATKIAQRLNIGRASVYRVLCEKSQHNTIKLFN
jgi:DNA invertase Pin-like site-specific DNA recombinase